MTTDVHQHLWPEPLLAALTRRRAAPSLRRHEGGWALRAPGEPERPVDLGAHDPVRRAGLLRDDGVDRAVVALSCPLGIEGLPPGEAAPLLDAYHEGVAALGDGFAAWAAVGVAEPDPEALAARLDAGFVGACVPADAVAGPAELERIGPVLETLERHDAPLFVHPGPARPAGDRPSWWPALTDYVAGMQAAWLAWAAWGRPAHPELRVCFAMLAGLAALQRERAVARGAPAAGDPLAFLDTSSYGPRAVDAVLREVGVDRLVHGSDRPVAAPAPLPLGDAVRVAVRERNPARLLASTPLEASA
jgi:predicted TIM-barrel fold metal-dependent hydrolase